MAKKPLPIPPSTKIFVLLPAQTKPGEAAPPAHVCKSAGALWLTLSELKAALAAIPEGK